MKNNLHGQPNEECGCGEANCSKRKPDGTVCTNPWHSSDMFDGGCSCGAKKEPGPKWWDDEDDWYWGR